MAGVWPSQAAFTRFITVRQKRRHLLIVRYVGRSGTRLAIIPWQSNLSTRCRHHGARQGPDITSLGLGQPGVPYRAFAGGKMPTGGAISENGKSARLDRDVRPLSCAGIELARPADALYRVLNHLLPLRDPTRSAGDGKQRGEHLGREAERIERYPRVEVDIRIKLLLDEIVVAFSAILSSSRAT